MSPASGARRTRNAQWVSRRERGREAARRARALNGMRGSGESDGRGCLCTTEERSMGKPDEQGGREAAPDG